MSRLGGDEALGREVIQLFLDDSPARMSAIKTAIAQGDARALESAAHALKGAVTSLAADPSTEAIRELERIARDGSMSDALPAWRRAEAALTALVAALRQQQESSVD